MNEIVQFVAIMYQNRVRTTGRYSINRVLTNSWYSINRVLTNSWYSITIIGVE